MLVLALEFSRGCTAHAGVGSPRTSPQRRQREQTPDRGTHGVSGPPAAGALGLEELESSTRTCRPVGIPGDVTGTDPPKGHSLKTE